MNKKKLFTYIFSIILTIIIFGILISMVDFKIFIENAKNINIFGFVFVTLLLLIPLFLMGYRWKVMISDYKNISKWESARLFIFCQSLNIITPSKMGDFAKAYLLKDKKFNLKIGASAALFEKALDFFALIVFALIGLIMTGNKIVPIKWVVIFLVFVIVALTMVFLLNPKSRLFKWFLIFVPFSKLKVIATDMMSYFQTLKQRPSKLIFLFILTFIIWFGHFLQGYLYFWVIGAQIDVITAVFLFPIGILAGMLPITLSGMGTREGTFVLLFSGILPTTTMVLFGLVFTTRYIFAALLGLVWVRRYIKPKNQDIDDKKIK